WWLIAFRSAKMVNHCTIKHTCLYLPSNGVTMKLMPLIYALPVTRSNGWDSTRHPGIITSRKLGRKRSGQIIKFLHQWGQRLFGKIKIARLSLMMTIFYRCTATVLVQRDMPSGATCDVFLPCAF